MESKQVEFGPCLNFIIPFHNRTLDLANVAKKHQQANNIFSFKEKIIIEEAFLVKHIAEWEIFLQNIFAYCVSQDTSKLNQYFGIKLASRIGFNNAYTILNGVDFLSLTSAEKIRNMGTKILSPAYNPFAGLDKAQLKSVDELYTIRNYLVHKSRRSREKLEKMYKNAHGKMTFIEPGEFLTETVQLGVISMPRSQHYFGGFLSMSIDIWKFLDPSSYGFVYEDDKTEKGLLKGMEKMAFVFQTLTVNNSIEY